MYKQPVATASAKSTTSSDDQSIEVEVRMTDGGFYVAFVRSIEEQSSQVYVTFEQNWQPGQCVPWAACRLAPHKFFAGERRTLLLPPETICIGDVVEAYTPTSNNTAAGWHRAIVVLTPDDGTTYTLRIFEASSLCETELVTVERQHIRVPTDLPMITHEDVHHIRLDVPHDLELPKDYDAASELVSALGDALVVHSYLQHRCIMLVTLYKDIAERALLIRERFFQNLRSRFLMMQKTEQLLGSHMPGRRALLSDEMEQQGHYVEVLEVPSDLVGLVIGTKGENINRARKLPGVRSIETNSIVNNHNDRQSSCHVQIVATTKAAALEARRNLEFTEHRCSVPKAMVDVLIEHNGRAIQELVDLTSVARARVEIDNEESNNSTMSTFSFMGLRHNVQHAVFLLEYQLKCIQQHQKMQKEYDALCNYLESTNMSSICLKPGVDKNVKPLLEMTLHINTQKNINGYNTTMRGPIGRGALFQYSGNPHELNFAGSRSFGGADGFASTSCRVDVHKPAHGDFACYLHFCTCSRKVHVHSQLRHSYLVICNADSSIAYLPSTELGFGGSDAGYNGVHDRFSRKKHQRGGFGTGRFGIESGHQLNSERGARGGFNVGSDSGDSRDGYDRDQ